MERNRFNYPITAFTTPIGPKGEFKATLGTHSYNDSMTPSSCICLIRPVPVFTLPFWLGYDHSWLLILNIGGIIGTFSHLILIA
jgi:hypothetical protein